jgi:cell division protein FtsB
MRYKLHIENPFGQKASRMLRVIPPKYLVATLFFLLWVGFFDGNSFMESAAVSRQIRHLEHEAIFYQEQVNSNRQRLNELKADNKNLEKFAREHYLMKRANEDIFIIVE